MQKSVKQVQKQYRTTPYQKRKNMRYLRSGIYNGFSISGLVETIVKLR